MANFSASLSADGTYLRLALYASRRSINIFFAYAQVDLWLWPPNCLKSKFGSVPYFLFPCFRSCACLFLISVDVLSLAPQEIVTDKQGAPQKVLLHFSSLARSRFVSDSFCNIYCHFY